MTAVLRPEGCNSVGEGSGTGDEDRDRKKTSVILMQLSGNVPCHRSQVVSHAAHACDDGEQQPQLTHPRWTRPNPMTALPNWMNGHRVWEKRRCAQSTPIVTVGHRSPLTKRDARDSSSPGTHANTRRETMNEWHTAPLGPFHQATHANDATWRAMSSANRGSESSCTRHPNTAYSTPRHHIECSRPKKSIAGARSDGSMLDRHPQQHAIVNRQLLHRVLGGNGNATRHMPLRCRCVTTPKAFHPCRRSRARLRRRINHRTHCQP